MTDEDDNEQTRGWIRELTAFGHVGMMFPVAIALGSAFGWWLDTLLGTWPWLALTGFVLGVVTAIRSLMQSLGRLEESERRQQERDEEALRARGGPQWEVETDSDDRPRGDG